VELVEAVKPTQCTLVPVAPGEVTSQAGWRPGAQRDGLPAVIARLRGNGIRVSVFVDAGPDPIQWAASAGADRVELYTEPFARAFERGGADLDAAFEQFASASRLAHQLGLGVNAGHDLDLDNLRRFRTLPFLAEVSIGHAIVSRAVFVGLATVVREYLDILAGR
jgi:pyridoxine 5-phosphate synthase